MARAVNAMCLRLAELGYSLDARGAGLSLEPPPSHAKFLLPESADCVGQLVLRVRNEPPPETTAWHSPLCLTKVWELWLDEAGRYIFVAPRSLPPRRLLIVDPDFTYGDILGDFSATSGQGVWPLEGVDVMLFANWLADYGDLVLHAAGVAVDGRGYAFAGPCGAGKSTLTAALACASSTPEGASAGMDSLVVLGEDQVILRYLEGRFWIFGTPWHFDADLCSPLGAPLERLYFLDRTETNGTTPLTPMDGVTRLLQTAFIPYYRRAGVPRILSRLALLSEQIPFLKLSYHLGSDLGTLVGVA